MADERETLVPREVRDVVRMARDEVVEPHHGMSVRKKAVAQVGAEEPRGSRDEHSHSRPRPIERYVNPSARIFAGS